MTPPVIVDSNDPARTQYPPGTQTAAITYTDGMSSPQALLLIP
jgi:hypothetical protein